MKPDKTKLLAKIEDMKSICSDGKREVRELIEELIGEKLTTDRLKVGQVWSNCGMVYFVAYTRPNDATGPRYSLVSLGRENQWSSETITASLSHINDYMKQDSDWKFEADSVAQYIKQGGKV